MHTYLLISALLLIALTLLFKNGSININPVYNIIATAAVIESLICILQYAGLIPSLNDYLKVSGTWVNPNVTAMFLAMSVPAASLKLMQRNSQSNTLNRSNKFNQKNQWLRLIAIIIIAIALILLQCRTALIGVLLASAIIFNNRFNLYQKFKTLSFSKRILYACCCLLIAIPLALFAYKAKQNSADGRKLVWKVSAQVFAQNPISGIGYGYFEHDYNLQQAKYFASGNGTPQEINNASFVNMAYNEFLQNGVEGGIIALVLFVAFVISLLVKFASVSNVESIAAYSGIAAFLVMSIFNFTIQAMPVMCLFLIYVAAICANHIKPFSFHIKPLAFGLPLLFLGLFFFFSQVSLAKGFAQTKQAIDLSNEEYYSEAINILEPLKNKMENSETYLTTFGKALYGIKKYKQATEKFNKAAVFTSATGLYLLLGNCYYKQRQFDSAISACVIAKNIAPNRIKPSYALMKIYQGINDTINVIKTANEIIYMQPKGISKEATMYKTEATKLINTSN